METKSAHLGNEPARIAKHLRRKRASKLFGIAAVAIFALAACTTPGSPASSSTTAEETSSAEAPEASIEGVDLPLDFQISVYQGQDVLGGEEVNFSEVVADGKPVVLNFWAGLCPPCRLEMPDLQEVHQDFGDQIVLVGVDVGTFTGLGDEQAGRALLQDVGVTYPTGTTANAEVMRAYEVIGMPTTLFISPDGEIVERWTGLLTKDKMVELVAELLEASARS